MKTKFAVPIPWLILLAAVVLLLFPSGMHAQGVDIEPPVDFEPFVPPWPEPRPMPRDIIRAESVAVGATIDGPIANVTVEVLFHNQSSQLIEGEFVMPLPQDASIGDFTMSVDGQVIEGSILDANEARNYYLEVVRQRRDPALLEYIGRGLFRTAVFPVPPGGQRTLALGFTQIVAQDEGLYHYSFPLPSLIQGQHQENNVTVKVELRNQPGLRTIYSPGHKVDIDRVGPNSAHIVWAAGSSETQETFDLFFGVSQDRVGLNLLSYKPAGEDGFFVLLAGPEILTDPNSVVQRDIVLVLDTSGSMEGAKIEQARNAAHYVVDHLNPGDRFNLVSFSTGVRLWQRDLQAVDARGVADAHQWIDQIAASGSTDINRAVLEGVAQVTAEDPEPGDRPAYVLFLTDGLPTVGETDGWRIVGNAEQSAIHHNSLRLFAFGIGYDVNTDLLDTLSSELGGRSEYVRPDEAIDEAVSHFYQGISTPVLSNIALDFGDGLAVEEVYPYPLPDLFSGGQMVVTGRYRPGGTTTIRLSGELNGTRHIFTYPAVTFVEGGGEPFVARLWATRKIGLLMESVRRDGPSHEVVTEIVELGLRYGIVTPYTSYLVKEPEGLQPGLTPGMPDPAYAPSPDTGRGGGGPADALPEMLDAAESQAAATAAAPASGAAAVAASQERSAMQTATTVDDHQQVRYINGRTFIQQGWVQSSIGEMNELWVDARFSREMTVEIVPFGSERYFELAMDQEMSKWMALSSELVIVVDPDRAIRITSGADGITGETSPDENDETGSPLENGVFPPVRLPWSR